MSENQNQNTALVAQNGVSPVADFFGGENVGKVWTSLKNDGSRESQMALLNAMDNVEANLRDICGEVLEVTDILCHAVNITTDSGEEIEAVRTVLIDVNGKCYATVGDGVRGSLSKMFAVLGLPPWNPPVKITPKEVKTRKGFRVLKLETIV